MGNITKVMKPLAQRLSGPVEEIMEIGVMVSTLSPFEGLPNVNDIGCNHFHLMQNLGWENIGLENDAIFVVQ